MYLSLYRRYRPQSFGDVAGQSTAVGVVRRAVLRGNVAHAYLFSGPRGCGKTTIARLFAKAVNCLDLDENGEPCNKCANCESIGNASSLDVIEIDGASNNKVDEIRDLKTHVGLASFSCRYKVYIIDEVHMLSIGAFNALLKTLEEPPESVLFILATTEPFKVPVTIRSRCQHIPFHSIGLKDMVDRMSQVVKSEEAECEEEALWEIARQADGGLRDGLSLLEQAMTLEDDCSITSDTVRKLVGGGGYGELMSWVGSFSSATIPQSIEKLESMFTKGASVERVLNGLYLIFRNLWIVSRWGSKGGESLRLSPMERVFLEKTHHEWSVGDLKIMMDSMASLMPQARRGLREDVLTGIIISQMVSSIPLEEKPSPEEISKPLIKAVGLREDLLEKNTVEPPCSESSEAVKVKRYDNDSDYSSLVKELSENFFDDIPQIVTALMISRVEVDDENMIVKASNSCCYNILTVDRYVYLLQSAIKKLSSLNLGLKVSYENDERLFPSVDKVNSVTMPVKTASDDAFVAPVLNFEEEPSAIKVEEGKKETSECSGLENAVRMINAQVGGELICFRRDQDEGEEGQDIE